MTDKKTLLDDLKAAVQEDEGTFSVDAVLENKKLEGVSGGCLCRCAADNGGNPTCGGGGGGGGAALEEMA